MIQLGINQTPSNTPLGLAPKVRPSKAKADTRSAGRPTVMTPETISKLEAAFMNAFTDEMACLYVGISKETLYEYCRKNPEFTDRKELLKISPDLLAQTKIVSHIKNDLGNAWRWAEHRMPAFMPKTKVEHSGKIDTASGAQTPETQKIAEEYEAKMKAAITEDAKKGKS